MIIAFDVSVTMQIAPGCSPDGCHSMWSGRDGWAAQGAPWGPAPSFNGNAWPGVRLYSATGELLSTLKAYKDDFVFGGFRYDTCGPGGSVLGHSASSTQFEGAAEITYMTPPDLARPWASFDKVLDMVQDIRDQDDSGPVGPTGYQVCERAEGMFPSGDLSNRVCVTPYCAGDDAWYRSAALQLATGGIPGIALPNFPTAPVTIACDKAGAPTPVLDPVAVLAASLKEQSQSSVGLFAIHGSGQVADFDAYRMCYFIPGALSTLDAALSACTTSPPPYTAGYSCDINTIAANICAANPLTAGTCLCEPNQAGCLGGGNDPCGLPWQWRSTQQLAICAAYATAATAPGPSTSIGQALLAQPDNVVNGQCRENAVLFFTDGSHANSPGVAPEASRAVDPAGPLFGGFRSPPYYSPADKASNAFVFRVLAQAGGHFDPDGFAMALGQPAALPATDEAALNASFARVANRLKQGVYFSGNEAIDTYGTRSAQTSYMVPGGAPSYPDDTYLGRPTHLSWWKTDPKTGLRAGSAPICETDWASRAGYSYHLLTAAGSTGLPPPEVEAALGPPLKGETWADGAPILAAVPDDGTIDRGDGLGKPVNPGQSRGFVFGYMLNGDATEPVIVGAPRDLATGHDEAFSSFELGNARRDRMIYTMAGGYLFGFNGGRYKALSPPQDVDGVGVMETYTYDDSGPTACTEVFRYLPSWVEDAIRTDPLAAVGSYLNLVRPQGYTNGQIVVREARVDDTGTPLDYATVLVMTQGAAGPNMAALDVTDPSNPAVLGGSAGEWSLPDGNTTSAEPEVYPFPAIVGGHAGAQTVVVMPGGDGGTNNLYVYSLRRSGVSLSSQAALPPGNYPSSAVCFDGSGRGTTTDCVVLSDSGVLVRVPVRGDGTLGAPVNLYAQYAGVLGSYLTNEKFYTHPAVYFTPEGGVAYVFGSGDPKNIDKAPTVPNRVYKVVDGYTHHGLADASAVCSDASGPGKSGVISLSTPAEMVVSPPIVARGVVAFTTYAPPSTACAKGQSYAYAMNFETCKDAADPRHDRPQAVPIGAGIAMSPTFQRSSDTVLLQTSAGTRAPLHVTGIGAGIQNHARAGLMLYFRQEGPAP